MISFWFVKQCVVLEDTDCEFVTFSVDVVVLVNKRDLKVWKNLDPNFGYLRSVQKHLISRG